VPARLRLRHSPNGESRSRELTLAEHVQDVGLVLPGVHAPIQAPAAGVVVGGPDVVARRDEVDAELIRAGQERSELDALVAPHTRIRRPARLVLVEEVREHGPLEGTRHVDHLEVDAGDIRDGGRVGTGLWSAATVLDAVEMHEVHVRADDLVSGLGEQAGGHRRVHPAGHRHQHRSTHRPSLRRSRACGPSTAPGARPHLRSPRRRV
jgi:hypothetical protein